MNYERIVSYLSTLLFLHIFIMPIQGVDILKGKSIHAQEQLLTEICLLSFFFYIL